MLLPAGVAALLQAPGGPQGAEDRARPERVEALAEPAARRVLGGGDADVVAPVVLDVEVAVGDLGQRDLGEPALVGLLLVAELVGGVDADAADAADRDGQADLVEHAHPADDLGVREQVERADEPGVLDGQEEVGDPAVVAVVLQCLDDVVRRVGAVEPDDQVDGGDDAEDDDRAEPEPHAPAGELVQADAEERQARHHQPDQPQVALLVGPVVGGARGDRAAERVLEAHGQHLPSGERRRSGVYRTIGFVNLVDKRVLFVNLSESPLSGDSDRPLTPR